MVTWGCGPSRVILKRVLDTLVEHDCLDCESGYLSRLFNANWVLYSYFPFPRASSFVFILSASCQEVHAGNCQIICAVATTIKCRVRNFFKYEPCLGHRVTGSLCRDWLNFPFFLNKKQTLQTDWYMSISEITNILTILIKFLKSGL